MNLCRRFTACRIIAQGGTDERTADRLTPVATAHPPTWLCWKILLTRISGGEDGHVELIKLKIVT
jgi:hypothetical protein